MIRPATITNEHLTFLDDLRASGETNMYGAGPYLRQEFGVSRSESHAILKYWMETFSERHPQKKEAK